MVCLLFFWHRKPALLRHLAGFGNRVARKSAMKVCGLPKFSSKKSLRVNSLCFAKPKFYMIDWYKKSI